MSEQAWPDVLNPSIGQQDQYSRVACPKCDAAVGHSCVDDSGYATLTIHGERVRAFECSETTKDGHDPVNHPKHYTSSPAKCSACGHPIECIDVVEHMTFNLGNAVKYLWRAGKKGDLVEDLEKARWYIHREIQRLGTK